MLIKGNLQEEQPSLCASKGHLHFLVAMVTSLVFRGRDAAQQRGRVLLDVSALL